MRVATIMPVFVVLYNMGVLERGMTRQTEELQSDMRHFLIPCLEHRPVYEIADVQTGPPVS
jgi:hypothetical protein